MTSVSAYVADISVPNAVMFGALYEVDPQGDPIWLAQTDDYIIQATDLGNWVTIPFNGAQILSAGTAYMIAIGGYAHPLDTFAISTSGNGQGATNHIQDNGCGLGSGGFGDWYWITSIPMIRMNMGTPISNISETAFEGRLEVYPNPSRGIFNISFTSETVQDLKVRVLNVIGEEILKEDVQQFVGEYVKSVNLNQYNSGIYFLEIETDQGVINKKIILQ